jgi:hypothetical protein
MMLGVVFFVVLIVVIGAWIDILIGDDIYEDV